MEVDWSEGMLQLFRKEIVVAWTWVMAVETEVDSRKIQEGEINRTW